MGSSRSCPCRPRRTSRIVLAFCEALRAFVRPRKLGEALVAALPVRTHKGTYREPDVLFMLAENSDRIGEQYWQGADLVMEVVSPGKENRERDFKEKRKDYARPHPGILDHRSEGREHPRSEARQARLRRPWRVRPRRAGNFRAARWLRDRRQRCARRRMSYGKYFATSSGSGRVARLTPTPSSTESSNPHTSGSMPPM